MSTSPYLDSLSVIVPAHNEAGNLSITVLHAAESLAPGVALPIQWILVDDGSYDATWDEIQLLAQRLPNVMSVRHAERRGLGAALWTGLAQACGTWCTWLPADGQIPPEAIMGMMQIASIYDGVLLMRDEARRNLLRRLLTAGFYGLMRLAFGFNPYGFSGTFLVPRILLADLPLMATTAVQNYAVVLHCLKRGCHLGQVTTIICPRRSGKSKVANLGTISRTFYEIVRLRLLMK